MVAGNAYRLLARKLPRYEQATPDRLWRHFRDNTGKIVVADDHVRVDLAVRTYTRPVTRIRTGSESVGA